MQGTDVTANRVQANRAIATAYISALEPFDAHALARLHSPDVTYDVLGTTALSGTHVGHGAVVGSFFSPIIDALAPDSYGLARESVVACVDEAVAVVLTRSVGTTTRGGAYEQISLYALTLDNDQVIKVEVAWDTAHVAEALLGDQLGEPRPPREVHLPPDLGADESGTAAADVTRAYYEAMSKADWETFPALHDPNVVFDLPGSLPVSGHFENFENCIGGVVVPWVSTFDPQHPPGVNQYRIVCSDNRRALAFMRASGKTPAGVEADVIMVQIFTVKDGRITHLNEHLDTAYLESVCWGNDLRDQPVTNTGGIDTEPR
jgi:ketosteroid isomerase-like protein